MRTDPAVLNQLPADVRPENESALTLAHRTRSKSVRELAAYWRVSPRKVRTLIRRGLLAAIDLGCGRQQLRITPQAIRECEQRLAVQPPAPRRKRRPDIDPEIERLLSEE